MKTNKFLYKALFVLGLLSCQHTAWGQETRNRYADESFSYNVSNSSNFNDVGNVCDGDDTNYAVINSRYSRTGTITFDFGSRDLSGVTELTIVNRNSNTRPSSVTVETSTNSNGYNEVVNSDLTFRNNIATVALNGNELERYVRLTFNFSNRNGRIYEIYFDGFDDFSTMIKHKDPKWFDIRDLYGHSQQSLGTFRYDQRRFDPIMSSSTEGIQAAHTYIDTIYVHKGTTVKLGVPTKQQTDVNSASSTQTYQRWYSYRTDGTFETETHTTAYDLLTPDPDLINDETSFYRLENGYVGYPIGSKFTGAEFYYPTNSEFEAMFPNASNNSNIDNDWYVVACDISSYTDFTENFTSKGNDNENVTLEECAAEFRENYWEPTLSVRAIFYIVGVDDRGTSDPQVVANWEAGHGRLILPSYQGGGTGEDKHYLEEYDITFPSQHLARWTDEVLSLSKDVRSYAIPGATIEEERQASWNVSLTSSNTNLKLTNTLNTEGRGEDRVIQFRGAGNSGSWSVPDNTTATVIVTKYCGGVTYNIARYNLTFKSNSVPLTQTQVANINVGDANEFRSPTWMRDNLEKLTELTFDFDESVAADYGQPGYKHYFTYPLDWGTCSYAFFDGSPRRDFIGQANYSSPYRWFAQWDYYALANDYVGYGESAGNDPNAGYIVPRPTEGLGKPEGTFFLYVDASDRPGVLARLPFDEKLCSGSELFVTAWMKSAGQGINSRGESSDDAAVLFTVMGVDSLADGTVKYTPIYRHSSGQLTTTTWLSSGVPGTGSNTNDWYQIYFSFMNNDDHAAEYDSYILQVENNCASSSGGDYYLDDIKVFIAQPRATVTQKEYTCTNDRTLMNIEMDWERLLSRLGGEGGTSENGIDFCFVDETVYTNTYNDYLAEHGGADAGSDVIDAAKVAALRASLEQIGNGETYDTRFASLFFKLNFEDNNVYGGDGHELAIDNEENGRYYFYRTGSEDDPEGRRLSVDFYTLLSPNRPYLMLIQPADLNGSEMDEEALIEYFAANIDEACGIRTRFYVASTTLIKINGEVVDPSTDFCEGQVFNFSAQLRYPAGVDQEGNDRYEVIESGVYFDWFFGSEQEFVAANAKFGGESLESALLTFREAYPDATDLNMTDTPWGDIQVEIPSEGGGTEINTVHFTENQYKLIEHYLTSDVVEGGINSRLVLHRENLDITLLENGLELVVQPIQTLVPPAESGLDVYKWLSLCWDYIPLVLTTNDRAPQLHPGFNIVQYPAEDFSPDLRIGLSQIEAARTTPIRIDLRGAQVVTDGATHLGEITTQENMNSIYLIDSDDPQYSDYFASEDFNRYSLPIGKIEELFAEEYVQGSDYNDHMNITFNLDEQDNGFKFNPREGYTYTFSTYFEEKGNNSAEVYNTCYGSFNVEMKVVPENLVWQGTDKDNWNNDEMWKRADATDLKINDASYTTNEANTTDNGFVPMLFSNVIMPTDSKAELYMAGYTEGGAAWSGSNNRPDGMGDPTENIQYDLMVYEDDQDHSLTTQRFRVNICNDIHFMQGAQMLHAEQLIYTKAWTDVTVPTKTWTLLSTPLQNVYAGDWYTTTSGTQADEVYFNDITFDENKNNRLNPAVYQRSWDTGATIVENQTTNTNVGFSTSTPMWSAAYNDASVAYIAGGGFSVKAADAKGTGAVAGNLLFRLPKADTEYGYSTGTIDRPSASDGKLFISGLLDRSDPLNLVRNGEVVTEPLTASQDGKYMIVGNPYMAPLDLQEFFEVNTNLTGKYWTETEKGPGAGGSDSDGNNWLDPSVTSTIAPYGAFFVEKTEATGENTVRFTATMQKFDTAESGTTTTSFTITAENEGGHSGAVLAYADNADNSYSAAEDVRLMRNLLGNNANELSVYTVAGDKAASVNRVKDAQQIPLGVFAADDDVTTLTFTGVAALMEPSLYDAEMNTDTPLTEGYTLTVNGASHGRYFIRAKGAGEGTTGITDVETGDGGVSVYSVAPRQVVVSSGAELLEVSVYSVGGAMLGHESVGGGRTAVTLDGIDSGVAIVRVTTADGVATRKITVK